MDNLNLLNSHEKKSNFQYKLTSENLKIKNLRYLSKEEYKKKLDSQQYPSLNHLPARLNNLINTTKSFYPNNLSISTYNSTILSSQSLCTARSRKTNSEIMLNATNSSRNACSNSSSFKTITISNALNLINSKDRDIKIPYQNLTQDIDPLLSCYYISGDHHKYNDKVQKEEIFNKYNIHKDIDYDKEKYLSFILNKDNNNLKLKTSKYVNEEYFKNHIKALKKLTVNKQIHDIVNNILADKQAKTFVETLNRDKSYKQKIQSMPAIKVSMSTKKNRNNYPLSYITDRDEEKPNYKKNIPNILSREEILKKLSFHGVVITYQNNKPKSRVQTSISLVGNNLYIFGGLCSTRLDDLWHCDLRDRYCWKQLKPISNNILVGRSGHSLNHYKRKLFIYGGIKLYKKGSLNEIVPYRDELIIYDLSKNVLFCEKLNQEVKYRRNHVSEIIGSYMFIFGGIDDLTNKFLSDFWLLDLDKFKWISLESKGQLPPPLAYHSSCLVLTSEKRHHPSFHIYKFPDVPSRVGQSRIKNEGVYIYGGMDTDKNIRSELRVLKIGKRPLEWTIIKTSGISPDGRVSATINFFEELNVVFLFGGKCEDQSISNELFLLDLENYCWTKILIFDRSPLERAEHSSCIYGNSLIIFGGMNKDKYLGSELYIVNLDISEKKRRKDYYKINAFSDNEDFQEVVKNILINKEINFK